MNNFISLFIKAILLHIKMIAMKLMHYIYGLYIITNIRRINAIIL